MSASRLVYILLTSSLAFLCLGSALYISAELRSATLIGVGVTGWALSLCSFFMVADRLGFNRALKGFGAAVVAVLILGVLLRQHMPPIDPMGMAGFLALMFAFPLANFFNLVWLLVSPRKPATLA